MLMAGDSDGLSQRSCPCDPGPTVTLSVPKLGSAGSDEAIVRVRVVHDPANPHDTNAVEIRSDHGVLGHLAREDALRYAPYLARIQTSGLSATTTARIWGRMEEGWDGARPRFWGNVRVELPEPHLLFPVNDLPSGAARILPFGGANQVTRRRGPS